MDALPVGSDASAAMKSALCEAVEEFNKKHAVTGTEATAREPETTGPQHEEPSRTMCKPQFSEGDRPLDFLATQLPAETLDLPDFESKKE